MKIIIHRGTHQIGGCITEIITEKARIIIDMGAELPNGQNEPSPPISIDGVTIGAKNCNAVFLTHYHGDHLGLYKEVLPDIPIYIGETAKKIFRCLCNRIDKENVPLVDKFKTYAPRTPVVIEDITVTPYFVDHSAYDSYMLLIEADGKKILHTGDFRTHGFLGKGVNKTLNAFIGQVDVLITEGTMLSRGNEKVMTEYQLELEAKKLMIKYKYVFVLCSSTNIDRIAAFYQANPDKRYFVCDNYQKDVLDIITDTAGKKSSLYKIDRVVTYGSNLDDKLRERGFCMLVRATDNFKPIIEKFKSQDAVIIYSMWNGYRFGDNKNKHIIDFLDGYNVESLHTSGHATKAAIEGICNIVKPVNCIIPIHSESPTELSNIGLPYTIKYLNDNEIFIL